MRGFASDIAYYWWMEENSGMDYRSSKVLAYTHCGKGSP
jgi:hypothetical protein